MSEQLSLLAQQLQPARDDREVLETLLSFIWEALCETGSPKAQIGGRFWRMMRRDAPKALSQTPAAAAAAGPSILSGLTLQNADIGQQPWANEMVTNGTVYDENSEWFLSGPGNLSKAPEHQDLGYGGM